MIRTMIRVRVFEERIQRLVDSFPNMQPVRFRIGGEAVASAVCSSLRQADRVFATADPHRHLIAKEVMLRGLIEDLMGTQDSRTLGKGGWADVVDESRGIFAGSGSPLSLAVGAGVALADTQRHRGHVTAVIVNSPVASELLRDAVEISRSWALPVLYILDASRCADLPVRPLGDLGLDGHIPRYAVDGNDTVAVATAVSQAARHARAGGGPSVIYATVHGVCDLLSEPPNLMCSAHDPLAAWRMYPRSRGLAWATTLTVIEVQERALIEEAVASLRGSAFPDSEEAVIGLYTDTLERSRP